MPYTVCRDIQEIQSSDWAIGVSLSKHVAYNTFHYVKSIVSK